MNCNTRYVQVAVFVGGWMCLGWFLRLGDEAYQLAGIPLVLVGVGSMAIGAVWQARSPWVTASKLPDLLVSFLTYIPVCFALEEVVFRGALDTHVWVPGSSRAQAWISAFAVSSLWGL